ncbi:MAG: phosphatase PAP2 family protein [Acidobacteriota bacterium]
MTLVGTENIIGPPAATSKGGLRLSEILVLAALGGMAGIAWANPSAVPLATRSSLVTVGLLFAVAAFALGEEAEGWRYWFRELLPVPVIPYIFLNLGRLIPLVNSRLFDAELEHWDLALLGPESQAALYALPLPPWLADVLTLAYSTFFFNPIVLVVALALRRDRFLPRVTSSVILVFLVSYAGYFLVPAYGPRATVAQERYQTLPNGLFGGALRGQLDHWEKTKTDAFPSGHTMVTFAVLLFARRRVRALYNALLPAGALLIAATVLLTYHYLVDVLVAIPLTAVSLVLARALVGGVPAVALAAPSPGPRFPPPA